MRKKRFFSILECMKISETRLGFIGFGHLAPVLCRAIDRAKLIPRSQILFHRRDPEKMKKNEQEFGMTATSLETLVRQSDLLMICVRPHQVTGILQALARLQPKQIITVASGLKIPYYQTHLGTHIPLLRAMPNIASAVGEGMTLFTYGPDVSSEFRSLTHLLFSCMGEVIEVAEETMDLGTAMSGSGPGFVFRLIEAMARAGEKGGIPYAKALKMAAQTFVGAGRLILKGGQIEELLQQIATPNGVTEAGLKEMSALHIDANFQSVIEASAKRSRELA